MAMLEMCQAYGRFSKVIIVEASKSKTNTIYVRKALPMDIKMASAGNPEVCLSLISVLVPQIAQPEIGLGTWRAAWRCLPQ